MVNVNVTGGTLSQKEIDAYIAHARAKYPNATVTSLDIALDGDFADITYHYREPNFERIRRITGYLVGTTERFNNAKRAEERDRVKHSVACGCCSGK